MAAVAMYDPSGPMANGSAPSAGPAAASVAAGGGASLAAGGADAYHLPHRLRAAPPSTVHANLHVKLDVHAGALSVDATGSIAVLAGRRGLHLVDLEAPYSLAATLHHQTKWDVTVAKFNPHAALKSFVASTSNHNTLIWNVAGSLSPTQAAWAAASQSPPLVATLRGHTRPVSDVAWAPTEPTLLATCSADAKTHIWDTRAPQRPVQTLHALSASAVHLAWHRADATTLATAHEGEVRVWDTRASDKTPAVLITAHMQKIYGVDWHPRRADELLTCSEDKTVKLWNVSQPRVCQGSLTTGAPVWRAKYTPVGDGIVTSSHRQDNTLRLWSLSYASAGDVAAGSTITIDQVHAFVGHADLVKSFVWRERATPNGNHYQLVSWSKNQELRMWRLDAQHLQACGHIEATRESSATNTASPGTTDSDALDVSLDHGFDNFELANPIHRTRRGLAAAKFDASTLKNDFVPLVVPPAAVPLGASEYSMVQGGHEENNAVLRALLTFDDDLSKIGEGNASDDEEDDEDETHNRESMSVTPRDKTMNTAESETMSLAAVLPCPRIFSASFSGPNVLVVFDSRVALGQTRHAAVTPPVAPVAPGKSAKPTPAAAVLKKLPRTYEQLLEMRDSRFSKKKNKKPPPSRILGGGAGGVGGGAMELSSEWSGVPLEFMDASGYSADDNGDQSVHGKRRGTGRGSGFFNTSAAMTALEGSTENEFAVHGGSEYLKTYFSSQEFHLPINHPDHRTSLPLSASIQGLSLSPPRSSMAASSGLIRGFASQLNMTDPRVTGKRVVEQQPVSSLQLDLSLSVSLLDLSRLCGVSPMLTYGTQLTASPVPHGDSDEGYSGATKQDAGTRDLYSWMLKATEARRISGRIHSRRARRGTSLSSPVLTSQKIHPLSRILQSLLAEDSNLLSSDVSRVSQTRVSDVCAHNARIASLAGRSDLHQVWSLLELTTASNLQVPQQQLNQLQQKCPPVSIGSQGVNTLVTSHPWRAHPFGENLVNKVLAMYEESGDLPTLAAIVCALQPPPSHDPTDDNSTPESSRRQQFDHDKLADYHTSRTSAPSLSSAASTAPATPSATSAKVTMSPFNRSRTSFNSLTQLLSGQSDAGDSVAPPAMRSARRSSSHNEVPKLSQSVAERGESPTLAPNKAGAKDWPMTARSGHGVLNRQLQQQLSPALGPAAAPSGWRGIDFDKIENPFKTWSGGSANARAEASPRPLTSDTFRPPGTPLSLAGTFPRRHRGSSVVDSDDETSLAGRIILQVDKRDGDVEHHILSTDPIDERRYDGYKEAYAEVLYRYGALNLRGDVLKSTATDTASSASGEEEDDDDQSEQGLRFGVLCRSCQSVSNGLYCSACRDFSIKCSVCQLVVRGQSMYCMTCGHGGHEQHMREWFETENACPTGCGCWCKQATAMAMPSAGARGGDMDQLSLAPGEGGRGLHSRSYSF